MKINQEISKSQVLFYEQKPNLTQQTFQHRIYVVSTLWINVEITLTQRRKWNKIRLRIFNVAPRWYNVRAELDVETTLLQCCFKIASTLSKLDWNQSDYYKFEFVNRSIILILLKFVFCRLYNMLILYFHIIRDVLKFWNRNILILCVCYPCYQCVL